MSQGTAPLWSSAPNALAALEALAAPAVEHLRQKVRETGKREWVWEGEKEGEEEREDKA